MSANASASAQKQKSTCSNTNDNHIGWKPRYSARPHKVSATVSYDATSTVLTVKFSPNSQGGTVEVYHNGAKVAGITANAGTTFSCVLREYGEGDYTVIVSSGNTVVDSRNFTVR